MVYSGKVVPELRKTLEVHNSFLGYAYLLDKEGLVRWKAHALPTQKELQTMTACTKQLLIE